MFERIKDALERVKDWYDDRENWVRVNYPKYRRPKGYKKEE